MQTIQQNYSNPQGRELGGFRLSITRNDVVRALRDLDSMNMLGGSALGVLAAVQRIAPASDLTNRILRGRAIRRVVLTVFERMRSMPIIGGMNVDLGLDVLERAYIRIVPVPISCQDLHISQTTYYRLMNRATDQFCDELARLEYDVICDQLAARHVAHAVSMCPEQTNETR